MHENTYEAEVNLVDEAIFITEVPDDVLEAAAGDSTMGQRADIDTGQSESC